MSLDMLLRASLETVGMVFAATLIAALVGIPIGFLLYLHGRVRRQKTWFYHVLAFVVNATRSIPFIILMVAVIPFTRALVGTSIGTIAAIVPLSLAAIPFLARLVESALLEIPYGLREAAESLGATTLQLVRLVLWPEALPGIINALTVTVVSLLGYSAMAGAIGGGGLGDLAIRFGYQRFDAFVMLITIVVLVVMVQALQYSGERLAHLFRRQR